MFCIKLNFHIFQAQDRPTRPLPAPHEERHGRDNRELNEDPAHEDRLWMFRGVNGFVRRLQRALLAAELRKVLRERKYKQVLRGNVRNVHE